MDTDVLNEFATLAQRLNYAIAARELNVSQSTLSRHISALERSLGVRLFTRGGRLTLTYAGSILLEEAGAIFAAEERIARRLAEARRRVQGRVRLEDYFFSHDIKNFMLAAARRYREVYPGVSFEFTAIPSGGEIVEMLDSGQLDVGVLVKNGPQEPSFEEESGYRVVPLWHEQSPMGVYLRKDVVAPGEVVDGRITIDVLRRLPVLLPLRPEYANFKPDMIELCSRHGFKPAFRLFEMHSLEDLALADMSDCVQIALASDFANPSSPFNVEPDCVFYPLEQGYCSTPYLLLSRRRDNPLLESFADFLDELAEERAKRAAPAG